MPTDNKPSSNEDEYFARANADLIKSQRAVLDQQRSLTERKSHWMKCPKCGADLVERTYHHVKIDTCPECGGTFLDKGELDMLAHVERNGLSRFLGDMLGLGEKR